MELDRKREHLEIALSRESQGPCSTWLEYVHPVHIALPELSIDDVDTRVKFLGYELRAPLIIEGMTGGSPQLEKVNAKLAELAQSMGIAIGVGSQRPMLKDPNLVRSYRVVREIARDVPVIANIGGVQLAKMRREEIENLVSSIEADALAVHLNPAQELVQPEGDRDFRGIVDGIRRALEVLSVPIIVKEVGTGLSMEVARTLYEIGVRIFDVAGAGGTNWIKIEWIRASRRGDDPLFVEVARNFMGWGIPTAVSVVEVRSAAPDAVIIASGGIRSGIDVLKSIALGADLAGIAWPALVAVMTGSRELDKIVYELRMAMLLTGSRTIEDVKRCSIVVYGRLAEWICARKLKLRNTRAYVSCMGWSQSWSS